MKLELKHLVGYLPYGLKFELNLKDVQVNYKNEIRRFTMTCSNVDLCLTHGGKPILRPLSDLTKEIDGVVHLSKLEEIYSNTPNFENIIKVGTLDKFNLCETNVEHCIVDYLLQHHFDVYGLIDKGLAIDINTLEQ